MPAQVEKRVRSRIWEKNVYRAFTVLTVVFLVNACGGGGGSSSESTGLADGLGEASSPVNTTYHPAGWGSSTQHGADFNTTPQYCKACHGDDLKGGDSGISCLTCHHGSGVPYPGHTGTSSHNDPAGCDGCHGDDFDGATFDGLAIPSCFDCHENGDNGSGRETMNPVRDPGIPDNGVCGQAGCHASLQSHPTHVGGNARGPAALECVDCHAKNPFIYDTYADNLDLNATAVCDSCHSPGGAFDGVSHTVIGAKVNWEAGVYSGGSFQTGKEQWCAGCHDDSPAFSKPTPTEVIVDNQAAGASFTGTWDTSSFAPGYYGTDYHYHAAAAGAETFTWTPTITDGGTYTVYARWTEDPSRASDATYTIYHDGGSTEKEVNQQVNGGSWIVLGTFSFDGAGDYVELVQNAGGIVIADAIKFESGPEATYAPNITGNNTTYGFYVTGHKIDCLECHDISKSHIDGKHRTYVAGSTVYGDSYRLKAVGALSPMVLPRPLRGAGVNPLDNANDFALCFSCHYKLEVLNVNPAAANKKTNFWNNDADPRNSHNIHLGISSVHFDSDWDGTADSSESCIACHNVHGAPNQAMVRHGELISSPGTTNKVAALDFAYLQGPAPGTRDTSLALAASIGGSMNHTGTNIADNGVCKDCHGAISYYRDPYLGPKVLSPKTDPTSVDVSGGPQSISLSVTVTDPDDAVPGGVTVTVDLSAFGHGSQTMSHQGDGLYTYDETVPGGTASGAYSCTVTANDGTDTGENTITVTVD